MFMTPRQSDVAPVRAPVHPARHLAAAPLPASTFPMILDPLVPILVAVAVITQAAVSVGENSDRRFPVTARRSADLRQGSLVRASRRGWGLVVVVAVAVVVHETWDMLMLMLMLIVVDKSPHLSD